MRVRPSDFKLALRVQWLCAAMDVLLGATDLAAAPALMSGFGSILDHNPTGDFAAAAFSLRQAGLSVASEIQLRQAVQDAVVWEDENVGRPDYEEPPYEIRADRDGYPFRRRSGTDIKVDAMVGTLVAGLGFETFKTPLADQTRPMALMESTVDGASRITVDLTSVPALPLPPKHDLTIPPRGPISIPLAELEAIARDMDVMDGADPRRPKGNWYARLREADGGSKFDILVPDRAAGSLAATDVIHLEGLKHLIGLPGTGKTTLIVLLIMWLDRNGYRTVVLLPSIEASLNLLGDLRFYGSDVGLLVGQSPQTRIEHARKLGERLGADETHGFGRTAPGADLLAANCALGAFDDDPDGHEGFPHLQPPCRDIIQRGLKADGTPKQKESRHLCPLGGWCGRLKAPRELTTRRVWLGHILSMDTRIGAHFADERLRYFEAVAMASDLVIIDEADGAQANLDRKAISALDLTGSEDSYEAALNRDLFVPIASGRNDITASNVQSYSATAADFGKLNRSMVSLLQRSFQQDRDESPIARFKDTFVTGNNVMTALFCPEDISALPAAERLVEEQRFNAIRAFWDGCIRAALFRRTDLDSTADDYEFDTVRVARDLGKTIEELDAAAVAITNEVRDWISEPLPTRRTEMLDKARGITFAFIPPRTSLGDQDCAALFRFLVGVSTVIFQFVALIPAQQAMVAEGIHYEPLFRQGISEDLARNVPDALLGRLSGLRYHLDEDGQRRSIRLQYVTFRGAPRALLYRLHHLFRHDGRGRGPAVLLASATSFLAESPTFHIPVGPDLVLRRKGNAAGWQDSRYVFAPPPDPDDPTRRLRFSGAPLKKRARILKQMIDHYFEGDDPLAIQMTRDFDPGRKVGFVVNSYDQVRLVKAHLKATKPDLSARVIGVVDVPGGSDGDFITASQVERLGQRTDWDVLVFPMKSLSRGVNIVFEDGPRRRDALIGTLVFLTRPHPATESLDLVAGLAGAKTLEFDRREFPPGTTADQMSSAWRMARRDLTTITRRLLRFPLQASRLGPLATPFTADIMVDVLQTIGRVMRNGCKARVVFADAAWAPRSAAGHKDSANTSMLVQMRDILRTRLADPDPVDRAIYAALYEPFLHPLERCDQVIFPDGVFSDDD